MTYLDFGPSLPLSPIHSRALQGFALVGPALHFWYGALAKVITQTGTQGMALHNFVTVKTLPALAIYPTDDSLLLNLLPNPRVTRISAGALMRLVADQLVFAPAFIAVFFSSLLILEVRSSL